MIDETVIGWGIFGNPAESANGEWVKEFTTSTIPSVTEHNYVYVKPYDNIRANKASAWWCYSARVAITSELGVNTITPAYDPPLIPEPSIMLVSGMALLMLKKKK